jgi:hypothetical protein
MANRYVRAIEKLARGRETIEAERFDMERVKSREITEAEALKLAAAWEAVGEQEQASGRLKVKMHDWIMRELKRQRNYEKKLKKQKGKRRAKRWLKDVRRRDAERRAKAAR